MQAKTITIWVCALTFVSHFAQAAEVTISDQNVFHMPIIYIDGKIAGGDLLKVETATAQAISSNGADKHYALTYSLNTPGGDIEEAIRIGRFFREILASVIIEGKTILAAGSYEEKTYLKSKQPWLKRVYSVMPVGGEVKPEDIVMNYSAGILIFYGAVERTSFDNQDVRRGRDHPSTIIPVMGIHRPYYDPQAYSRLSPSQAGLAYKNLEALVRGYMAEMGAPALLVDRMFNTPSNQIDLVPDTEFSKYYKKKESFLDEWLIAKCGSNDEEDIQKILGQHEAQDFAEMSSEQRRQFTLDKNALTNPKRFPDFYPSEKFSYDYMYELYSKVRKHNEQVSECQSSAIFTMQKEWANKFSHRN